MFCFHQLSALPLALAALAALVATSRGDDRPVPANAVQAPVLPHREQIAAGIYVAGFSDRYHSTNCGWAALADQTLLIDLPRGIPVPDFMKLVAQTTGKPARTLALTNIHDGDTAVIRSLLDNGVNRVLTSAEARKRLLAADGAFDPSKLHALTNRTPIGDAGLSVEFLPFDHHASPAGAAVWIPSQAVLFSGPLVVHGPRAALPGSDTAQWVTTLRRLEVLVPARVVPGSGSWGGPERLTRQRRFLTELRRQVAYHICQGRPHTSLRDLVRLPPDFITWTPYGNPTAEDIEHVYQELTVPNAPFNGQMPTPSDSRPHALVLIGDEPHEPGHIEEGLRPVFEATGVISHFAVDVNALSAPNLAKVQLLVILRDGIMRSTRNDDKHSVWMKPEQERAVVAFVEGGGGFLNLHNALAEYPKSGPYLNLLGGRYVGHGPLERFQIEIADRAHPVTRGVESFFVADEQHTPLCNDKLVHVLLHNRSDDGKTSAAGWVRESGKGRVCHLANGHTEEALLHPMYQRLLCNAVRWCLHSEDSIPTAHSPLR